MCLSDHTYLHRTDVEVGLDATGDTGSSCAGGWNGRQKPLCCNTPSDLNPFLPVPLDHLFPTLPPTSDIPGFDLQQLSPGAPSLTGEGSNLGAFGFVVIDGPAGTVTNVAKRDGSHIEFISRGEHHGPGPQTAQFVCLNAATAEEDSNCNDMYRDGLPGTILRMPDDQGFAKYVVAHSVTLAADQGMPDHVRKRALPNSSVWELEYSYDFAKVKRDSGPVYVRIDYSDSHTYYDKIVAASPSKKRDLEPRFWSKITSVWATRKQLLHAAWAAPYANDEQCSQLYEVKRIHC